MYTKLLSSSLSFQFSSELCFLGESSFEAQSRIKIFIFKQISPMKFTITKIFFMKQWSNFFTKQIFYETIFFFSEQKNCQSSFTSFTTYSTLATTILKLLHGPSESARVFGDPIYARGKARAKKTSA